MLGYTALSVILLGGCSATVAVLDFTAEPASGQAPLEVTFTSACTGTVVSYDWDFGDGERSSDAHPSHTYEQPGLYTVSLVVVPASGDPRSILKPDCVTVLGDAPNPDIFWSERGHGQITRGDRAGLTHEVIVSGLISPEDLTISASLLFWSDYGTGKIERGNLDGSGRALIAEGQVAATGIAVDAVHRKVYWSCLPSGPSDEIARSGVIRRADLDGTNVESLVEFSPDAAFAWQIAIDARGGHLYWISLGWDSLDAGRCDGRIMKAGLDAKNAVAIATGLCEPTDLTTDASFLQPAAYVYWTSEDPGSLSRVRVSGSAAEVLVTGIPEAESVAVDPDEGYIYWTAGSVLQRATLNGDNVMTVFSGLELPEGVAIER
jgi:PKD repeat protein